MKKIIETGKRNGEWDLKRWADMLFPEGERASRREDFLLPNPQCSALKSTSLIEFVKVTHVHLLLIDSF